MRSDGEILSQVVSSQVRCRIVCAEFSFSVKCENLWILVKLMLNSEFYLSGEC